MIKLSIKLTKNAVAEIRKIKIEQNIPVEIPLRVGIKGGGCSGFLYFMNFDEKTIESDEKFDFEDVSVIVDSKSLKLISGLEIDFNNETFEKKFIFKNPNASHKCSCGNSFTV